MDPLYKGALATGIAAATGMITALPTIDAEHFSPVTIHGVERLAGVIIWTIVIAEARYWKAWADKITGNGGGPSAVAVILLLTLPFLTGCPKPEVSARDAIAAAHGYVVYGQAKWKVECSAVPSSIKCQLTNKLIAAEHAAADVLAVYCAGTPLAGNKSYAQGGECVEVKAALPALKEAGARIKDLIKQVNVFLPSGTKVQSVTPGGSK